MKNSLYLVIFVVLLIANISCQKKSEDKTTDQITDGSTTTITPRWLYVSSGSCFSGVGNTTFTAATASNLVYRLRLDSAYKDLTLADYNTIPANLGDTPVGISKFDSNNIAVLVENAVSGRRLEKIPKSYNGSRTVLTNNGTILSAALRNLIRLTDGSYLISKSTAIEKVNSLGQRQTVGANLPYINAPAGTCSASILNITQIGTLSNGKIFFTHGAAAQNRFGLISASGYVAAGDCLSAQTAPNVAASPTAAVYLPNNSQLIVAYAGNAATTDLNSIYVYNINETTNAITTPTKLIDSPTNNYIYGISAMAYDEEANQLYVATSATVTTTIANYNIEKFDYNPTTKVLTRVGAIPFYTYGFDTKCISQMFIEN